MESQFSVNQGSAIELPEASMKKILTPGLAIERLKANDPTFTSVDLSNNAVLQMKGKELMPQLAEALSTNTVCQELILVGCGINDFACEHIGTALAKNNTLIVLNLENNIVNNDGAIAVARALGVNRGLLQLNLMNQKGSRFGESTVRSPWRTEQLTHVRAEARSRLR